MPRAVAIVSPSQCRRIPVLIETCARFGNGVALLFW
jgi:hypothetical protein